MDININELLSWKKKIDQKVFSLSVEFENISSELRKAKLDQSQINTVLNVRSGSKSIFNKSKEIRDTFFSLKSNFSFKDVKNILEHSEYPEVRNIDEGYISAQLGICAKKGILVLVEKGGIRSSNKKGASPHIYRVKG